MKKYRLATVFLIALMATGIFALAPPLISADPWSPGRGPPIVVGDYSIAEWDPIKPINVDPLGDTEGWSKNGTTALWPDGRLIEIPANIPLADACRDLEALYMWFEPAGDIYIRVDLAALTPGFGFAPPPAGPTWNYSMFGMTLSTDLNAGAGYAMGPYSGMSYLPPCEWEYLLVWSEGWIWVVGHNGTDTVFVDGDPASAAAYGLIGNCTIGVDYVNAAIEIMIPRISIENPAVQPGPQDTGDVWRGTLGAVSITLASFKPGLWPGVTSPPGLPGGGPGGFEDTILHPYDPQGVINGMSPPAAGEEMFQAGCGGPDFADLMAPTVMGVGGPAPGWQWVDPTSQKFVDMSVGAKIEAVDAVTGQQNITDTYSYNQQFTIDIDITDATNLTGVSLGLTWDQTVLECLDFHTVFGATEFLGSSANWIGLDGTVDQPNGRVFPPSGFAYTGAGTGPSGSGTIAKATFNVTVPFGNSWICPVDWGMEFELSATGKIIVEYAVKNAWFLKSPPSPGPPELIYTQDPAAPPHYPGDEIKFNLCGSQPGFNGTVYIPIVSYSLTVWNSSGMIYSYVGPICLLNFTPLSPDTYIFELDISLDGSVDPLYPAQWLHVAENVTKIVMERQLTGIDCFTEIYRRCGYETPFIGKGENNTADAYSLDEEVTLYAYVFYNGWPKQSFIVSFEVYDPNGTLVLVRTAMTNDQGIATISFRILTVCLDPEYAFGKWHCFQKVYMCEEPYTDTLWWDVGWLVELISVVPTSPVFEWPECMGFIITGKNIGQISRDVVWSVVVYDDDDVPIVSRIGNMTVTPGRYCDPEYFEILVTCMAIPKWFYPGIGKVYVNAWFNGLPTECGHACCPEISEIFLLTAPPFDPDP